MTQKSENVGWRLRNSERQVMIKVRKHAWTTMIRQRRKNWSQHKKTKNHKTIKNKVTSSRYHNRSEGDKPHFE